MAKKQSGKYSTLKPAQVQEYIRAANKVNRQMRRLVEQSHKNAKYAPITDYAYRVLQTKIKSFFGVKKSGEQYTRFPTSKSMLPKTVPQFRMYMNAINEFYKMPTSTIKGVQSVYEKRAKTLSQMSSTKGGGVEISWQDFAKVFETGLYETLAGVFGNYSAFKMIGRIEKDRAKLLEDLKAGKALEFNRQSEYGRMISEELGKEGGGKLEQLGFSKMLQRYLNETG